MDYSLISQVAYEKLCDIGPNAAIDFVLQCVPGMPEEYAVVVVIGKGWLKDSDDDNMVEFTTTRPDGYFKTPDLKWLCTYRMDDMKETMKAVIKGYNELTGLVWVGGIDVNECSVNTLSMARKMLRPYPGERAEEWYTSMWDKIESGYLSCPERIITWLVYIIKNAEYFIKDCKKSYELWAWARECCGIRPEKDVNFYRMCGNIFDNILKTKTNDRTFTNCLKKFKKDIESIIDNDDFMKFAREGKAIACDIMDGYDAGWLSPEGTFYGADGDTSALLHLSIADELGINDHELEKSGWVKTHHETCYSRPVWNKDENPSEFIINPDGSPWNGYVWSKPQMDAICKYIDKFYNGVVDLEGGIGYHPKKTSELRQMDIIALHETLSY